MFKRMNDRYENRIRRPQVERFIGEDGSDGYDRDRRGGRGDSGKGPGRPNPWALILAAMLTLGFFILMYNFFFGGQTEGEATPYTTFLQYIEEGKIESVEVHSSGAIYFTQKEDTGTNPGQSSPLMLWKELLGDSTPREYTILMEDLDTLTARLEAAGIEGNRIPAKQSGWMDFILTFVLPIALCWILLGFMFRKMGGGAGFSVGKSTAKVYVQKQTGVTFKDVAGEDEAKESLVEVVDFLHNPGKYAKIGARLPKGALLVGPPGTGKTLLAKAVAGEAQVPFFSLTGSDFIELYVGVGASRVRDLFKEANKNAPCIIFIDEIDAIGRSRDSKFGGGNEEREQTLNQLLSEMDGFDSSKGILILGATNRPEILDKALLRPGRFDRRIIVDKPDLRGRVEILKVHSKDVKMDETVNLEEIALATSGAVGSDLANMINEAAINAVKEGREFVSQKDLFGAVEVVLVGKEKKDRIMSPEERRIVSYHEVGHALISALQKNSEPVQKITIVPRTMGALGYVMHVPEEEKYLNTEAELHDMLVGLVGGRAAEEIVFDTVTTGAANDIERATDIARNMVTRFGMSRRFGLAGFATIESQYLEGRTSLNCSDKTAAEIDAEVVEILKESYEKALSMLRENRDVMDKLAEFLIEKETITGHQFMEIYCREKGLPMPEPKNPAAGEAPAGKPQSREGEAPVAEAAAGVTGSSASAVNAGEKTESQETEGNDGAQKSASESDPTGVKTGAEGSCEDAADASVQPAAPESPEDNRPRGRFSNGTLD